MKEPINIHEKTLYWGLVGIELNPGPQNKRHYKRRKLKTRGMRSSNNENLRSEVIKSSSVGTLLRPAITRFPTGRQFFPDVLYASGKTILNLGSNSGAAHNYSFQGNSPFNTFGPRVDFSGSYATNVPAGGAYLYGSEGTSTANGPYGYMWCIGSDWEIDVTSFGSVPLYAVLLPTNETSISGMSLATAQEQRGAISIIVPGTNTAAANTLRYKIRYAQVFGVLEKEYENLPQYGALPANSPVGLAYMQLFVSSADGTTAASYMIKVRAVHHIKFGQLNILPSVAPSLLKIPTTNEDYINIDNNNNNNNTTIHDNVKSSSKMSNPVNQLIRKC